MYTRKRGKRLRGVLIFFLFTVIVGFPLEGRGAEFWKPVGSPGFSSGQAGYISLCLNQGIPYIAYLDSSEGIIVKKYDGNDWVPLGNIDFSQGQEKYISLAVFNGIPFLAYQGGVSNNYRGSVKKYSGDAWENVGSSAVSKGGAYFTSLFIEQAVPYLGFIDEKNGYKATAFKFNGSNWEQLGGSAISTGEANYISLQVEQGIVYLAYRDKNKENKATVMSFEQRTGSWQPVGNVGFSEGTANFISLYVSAGLPYVAYCDLDSGYKVTVKKYNGSQWETVGNAGFSDGKVDRIALVVDDELPYVAYKDQSINQVVVKKYNGIQWETLGNENFSGGSEGFISLALSDGFPYLGYQNGNNENKATVMKYVPNQLPLGSDSNFTTFKNTVLSGSVVAFEPDGEAVCYSQIVGPKHGSLTFNLDGSFNYLPEKDYIGDDSFDWRAFDGFEFSPAYTVSLRVELSEQESVELDASELKIAFTDGDSKDRVTENLILPTAGAQGSSIVWSSSRPEVISSEGKVSRPLFSDGDVDLVLTAILTKGEKSSSKCFSLRVLKTPSPDYGGDAYGNSEDLSSELIRVFGVEVFINGSGDEEGVLEAREENRVLIVNLGGIKLSNQLVAKENGAIITVRIPQNMLRVQVVLDGQTVKNLENKNIILQLETGQGVYVVPAEQINIDQIALEIGDSIELQDIAVKIGIALSPENTVLEKEVGKNGYQLIGSPVEFGINCTYRSKNISLKKFTKCIKKLLIIPEHLETSNNLTCIILKNHGFSPAPVIIREKDGKRFAEINSLSTGIYNLVKNLKKLNDLEGHWASEQINYLCSNLIMGSSEEGDFQPEQELTRAEFSFILANGLGLGGSSGEDVLFSDFPQEQNYREAVAAVAQSGIAVGYGDGSFRPQEKITREEAITMVGRTLVLVDIDPDFSREEEKLILAEFVDSDTISNWAEPAVALCIKAGIISGYENRLDLKEKITQAQTAVLIRRLLQEIVF